MTALILLPQFLELKFLLDVAAQTNPQEIGNVRNNDRDEDQDPEYLLYSKRFWSLIEIENIHALVFEQFVKVGFPAVKLRLICKLLYKCVDFTRVVAAMFETLTWTFPHL